MTSSRPFPDAGELAAGRKPAAFLIVKSMLLTGFDAPGEQVLYLDRSMKEAELLQAVARVNRPADGKMCGYVIDYVGVTNHLTRALKAYSADDIQGALKDLRTEIGHLRPQRDRIRLLFTEHGVTPGRERGRPSRNCVELLEDGPLRDRFEVDLKKFLATVDTVLPAPRRRAVSRRCEAVRRDRACGPPPVPNRRRRLRPQPVRGEGP